MVSIGIQAAYFIVPPWRCSDPYAALPYSIVELLLGLLLYFELDRFGAFGRVPFE